jgi:hypothetical protein
MSLIVKRWYVEGVRGDPTLPNEHGSLYGGVGQILSQSKKSFITTPTQREPSTMILYHW